MDRQNKYYTLAEIDAGSKAFFAGGVITWERSKEEVWGELMKRLEYKPAGRKILLRKQVVSWSVAATIAILIGTVSLFWFYTKTYECPVGQHFEANLPDGTHFHLNAGSEMKFYPYRWGISRLVKLDGEGYFEVVKGDKFQVVSNKAKTVVLGTSFNIYARNGKYNVTCLTGKVKVVSANKNTTILQPNQRAELNKEGSFSLVKNYQVDRAIAWRNNQFIFTGTPIKEVASEISRQYGIKISLQNNYSLNYTGNFNKTVNVEEVLDLVCKPLSLNFVKKSEKEYMIVHNR